MLLIARKITDLSYDKLMTVYSETVSETAKQQFSREPEYYALQLAEQDWYQYLKDCFFTTKNAFAAVWIVDGKYVSIFRAEPYMDGVLIAGLETSPEARGKGYATALLTAALAHMNGSIYSHIRKNNAVSIRVHEKCGFQKVMDTAWCLDGSFSSKMGTWVCRRDKQ